MNYLIVSSCLFGAAFAYRINQNQAFCIVWLIFFLSIFNFIIIAPLHSYITKYNCLFCKSAKILASSEAEASDSRHTGTSFISVTSYPELT